jgi:NADPH:quinone reductase-like Zn-dependent oxidoreductase
VLALVADRSSEVGLSHAEVPEPDAHPGEALVEQHATSLNRGELRRLPTREEGTVPGWDVAGVVARAAKRGGPAEGARVVGLVNEGAWAERVAVPAGTLAELPGDVSFSDAATLPVAGITAYRTLALGGLLIGRRVLITGASGGVGRFAIQLARRAGAHVTAVAGSERRAEGLRELGADEVSIGFGADGPELDLILESAGGDSLAAALRRVARGGTVVSFGNSSGEEVRFDASEFYGRAPTSRVYAFMVFDEIRREDSGTSDLRALAEMVAAGELKAEVSLEASWRDPAEAIQALLDRRVAGKAVLRFDS